MRKAWTNAKSILAVRLDAMGDVLMTTPALRALKGVADRRITLLTSRAGASIAALIPDVDDVIVYAAPWMKTGPTSQNAGTDRSFIDALRRRRFDAAVVFTVYSQNPLPAAFSCYLADIPLRAAHCRENPYRLLTDWMPDRESAENCRHEVRRQLDLVAALGFTTPDERLALRVPPDAAWRTAARLRAAGVLSTRPWVVVHAGASAPSRRYAVERFVEVVGKLVNERGLQVVLTGAAEEAEMVEVVRRRSGAKALSLAGTQTLAELTATIAAASLLISNNTGPVHIAAAVGTPVVDLYALTNPQHAPWQVPHRLLYQDVPCRYCYKSVCPQGHHRCLDVAPQRVLDAVDELLAKESPCIPSV